MDILKNFLTSGHYFSKNENLQKFRFALINSLIVFAILITLINYFASILHFITFTPLHEKVLLIYFFVSILYLFMLRKSKNYYFVITNFLLFTTLFLVFSALVTEVLDGFRLIWFFLILFTTFILLGKKYGIFFMILSLIGVFFINKVTDLGFSKLTLFTFSNSFFLFTALAYAFLYKIEQDEIEFQLLNNKLKEKVSEEVQQRKEQEKMLLQQCRLASMGEMIDSIAHQWRQPLMSINAILMNMERGMEININPKPYIETKMDEVVTLTTHMSQTIEDFRSLFDENKEMSQFYSKDVILHAISLLGNTLNGIEIEQKEQKEVMFYGYKNELIQVIIILLSNAVEALKNRKIENKKIMIILQEHKNNFLLSIEDNAGGINENIIDRIFDPYFTTKNAVGGTGLGLYIAKIIIEGNIKGSLYVSNARNGAKFDISIPKRGKGRIVAHKSNK